MLFRSVSQSRYIFYFSGSDQTSKTKALAGNLGANLVTDSAGSLVFDFYYNDAIITSDSALQNQFNSDIGGIRAISLTSADSQSFAYAVIGAKSYVTQPINTGAGGGGGRALSDGGITRNVV